jgi:ATP-binding cassette subfamily C protein
LIETLRKAIFFLDARRRRAWLALVPLSVLTAGLEAIGAGAVFALIRMIDEPGHADSLATADVLRRYSFGSDVDPILAFALLVAAFYFIKNAFRMVEVYVRRRCAAGSETSIGSRLLARYLSAPYAFHLRRNSAELIRNINRSSNTVANAILMSATAIASESLVVVGILAVVIGSAPTVALAASGGVALVMMGLLRLTQSRHTHWGRSSHQLSGSIMQTLQQSLGGVKEVKVLGREAYFASAFRDRRVELARLDVARGTLSVAPRMLVETLFVFGVVAVIVGVRGGNSANLVPLLGLFAYAGLRILPSLHWIVYYLNDIRFARAPMEEVYEDWVRLGREAVAEASNGSQPIPFGDRISIEQLTFCYPGADRVTLQGIDVSIGRGESIGVVGPTGAGKSTLIDLILGLLAPDQGRITVDGVDISGRIRAWQDQIGYVPQSIYLTDDSIRRNVAFGIEDAEIDEERVDTAIRMAQIDEFIGGLSEGLDTLVGERGVRLSGGQRQRIAVARALYNDPEVLVFDEATAALDPKTERELTREIETLQHKKTLIIIAHRLSTVRQCDRVIFLDQGRIVDVAPFEELHARNAEFRKMAANDLSAHQTRAPLSESH